MDLDVIFRQVPALILANQQMGAQIADLDRRLKALEPQAEEPPKNDQEPSSEVLSNTESAEETQDGHEDPAAPTPADDGAEAGPREPQATEQP